MDDIFTAVAERDVLEEMLACSAVLYRGYLQVYEENALRILRKMELLF